MNITVTPAAEKFIRRIITFGGRPGSGLRLKVSTGGCSGLAAEFDVEASPRAGDAIHTHNGLKLFLPAESRLLLDCVTIDFKETRTQSGFVFHDPKPSSCGCPDTKTVKASELVTIAEVRE